MPNYWRTVNKVIREADVILLVLDSRMPELTRNREIETKIRSKKKLIYVLNKCDLISKKQMEKLSAEYDSCIFVSSKKKVGGTLLFRKILELSLGKRCKVGVLGYPNVGKSSVINLLKGKKAASVSSESGHTKGAQFVNVKNKFMIIDTPGVLAYREKDIEKMVMIGSINPSELEDPDIYAAKLIERYPELFEQYFDHEYTGDPYVFMQELNKSMLLKGGKPDMKRFARKLLRDWQRGKLHNQKQRDIN